MSTQHTYVKEDDVSFVFSSLLVVKLFQLFLHEDMLRILFFEIAFRCKRIATVQRIMRTAADRRK